MKQDEIYQRAFREIYYYAVNGLGVLANGWTMPDMSLQISALFVAKEDKKWVRNLKLEPVPIEQLKDPQKGFLEICRICYPDPTKEVDLRGILLALRDVSGRFLSREEKATPYEPITLDGFVYLAGIKREQLEGFALSEAAIQKELNYWEELLGKI